MSKAALAVANGLALLCHVSFAGCTLTAEEPLPTIVPTAEMSAPPAVVAAQDVVLRFLRTSANQCVPPEGAFWQVSLGAAPAGFEVYRFTTGDCLMTVSYPLDEATEVINHVTIGDQSTGFCWQANVSPRGEVLATGRDAEMLPELLNAAAAYCEEQGNSYEIRTEDDGRQCGFCVFEDGTSCNAWTHWQGRCGPASEHADNS